MNSAILFLIIFAAAVFSGTIVRFCLPKIVLLCLKKGILDPIDPRKVHSEAASRLGGISFMPAILISTLLCIVTIKLFPETSFKNFGFNDVLAMEFAGLMILYFVGIYDDIMTVKYRNKFFAQIFTAGLVVITGTYLEYFYTVNQTIELNWLISIPISIILMVFITNAINLIDGINGLASMLSIMAFGVYGTLFWLNDDITNSIVCYVAVGALLPFWYHNVFGIRQRTNARIFMGDGGALVVGFLLSVMAIKLWNISSYDNPIISSNIYHVLAYTMLFVPCLDVVRVVLLRARKNQPLFMPDKNHIHHKFMRMGFTPRRSLLPIIGIQFFFVVLNIALSLYINILYVAAIDVVVWTLLHVFISKRIAKYENAN